MTDTFLFFAWLAWPLCMFIATLWITELRLNDIERRMCDDCFFKYKERERLDSVNGDNFWRSR